MGISLDGTGVGQRSRDVLGQFRLCLCFPSSFHVNKICSIPFGFAGFLFPLILSFYCGKNKLKSSFIQSPKERLTFRLFNRGFLALEPQYLTHNNTIPSHV